MARFPSTEQWYRWSAKHSRGIDVCVAGVVTVLSLLTAAEASVAAVVVSLGMTVPLAWRRSHTVVSGFVIAAFSVLHLVVIAHTLLLSVVAVPIALYAFAAYGPRWSSFTALGLAMVGAVGATVKYFSDSKSSEILVYNSLAFIVFVLAVWAFGDLRRVRMKELEGLAERARLLELEREQEAEIATITERTRIAREMHDIVAHSLTVVIAQADGGRYGAAQDPAAAVAALETIAATGRQALTDMRALLSVLREDRPRDFAMIPGASDIESLVADLRRSGVDVHLQIEGNPRELPPGTSLTAYRIVQESLTNVLKHAGPGAHADVEMSWTEHELVVTVVDDGRGVSAALIEPSAGGQGLIGMTERARLHGGRVTAGPKPGGGYRVRAVLPHGNT